MNCCGQKRQAWREMSKTKVQAVVPSPLILQNPILLHHLGSMSLVIKGAVTGVTYLFAGQDSSLAVDERDVPTLMVTRQFIIKQPRNDA
jgi:hypothetical protein